jgi:hypothetical protein
MMTTVLLSLSLSFFLSPSGMFVGSIISFRFHQQKKKLQPFQSLFFLTLLGGGKPYKLSALGCRRGDGKFRKKKQNKLKVQKRE